LIFNISHLHGLFDGKCCVDTAVGMLIPNWGDNSTFVRYESIDDHNTTRWQSPDPEHSFNVQVFFLFPPLFRIILLLRDCMSSSVFVQADAPFLPARFGFPNPVQDLFFDANAFSFDDIPASVFTLPPDCTQSCSSMLQN
jgi:hypothetical protein